MTKTEERAATQGRPYDMPGSRAAAREAREHRRQKKIGEAIIGVCAGMGAIWILCIFAELILKLLGVN